MSTSAEHFGSTEGQSFSSEYVLMTPEKAQYYLDEAAFPRQRRVSQNYVDDLKYVLAKGEWKCSTIEICTLYGKEYVTDGNHRLRAIVEAGIPGMVLISKVHAKDDEELSAIYARTDRGRSRSIADAVRAFGLNESPYEGQDPPLQPKQLTASIAAFNLIRLGFGWSKPQIRDRLHLRNQDKFVYEFSHWFHYAVSYYEAIKGAHSGLALPLTSVAPTALGMVTIRYQSITAIEFWKRVATDGEIDSLGPIARIRETLKDRANPLYRGSRGAPIKAKRLAHSWNAHLRGESQSKIVVRRPDSSPIIIAGTPYDGKHLIAIDGSDILLRAGLPSSRKAGGKLK